MATVFGLKADKGGGGGTEKPPPGNHLAVLVGIFDMGHQLDDFDPTKEKWQHRAFFVWELVNEKVSGTKDRNHVIGIDLTLSLNEKAKLRKWIEARTGRVIPDGAEYPVESELGQSCLLNVIEKNKYPKIDGVAAVPKGFPVPPPTYSPSIVTLAEFRAGTAIPEWCPYLYGSPLAEHIRACREIGGARPRAGGAKKESDAAPEDGTTGDGGVIPF